MAGPLIGALRVSLSAETSAFEAGMARSQKSAATTARSINSSFNSIKNTIEKTALRFVEVLTIGAFIRAGKEALDYAGSLGETAEQLGVTTRELQTFRFAAQQNGASLEEADQSLGKFSLSMSKALAGSKQAAAAYQAVGVSIDDLKNKSKSEVLGQIADEMKRTGGASANAAAGVAIFGRGFQKIIPTLNLGSKGISELASAAEELGIVLSDEQIQKADQTADKLDALKTVLKAQIASDVVANADAILSLVNSISELVGILNRASVAWNSFMNDLARKYSVPAIFNQIANRTAYGFNNPGQTVTVPLPDAKPFQGARKTPNIDQFLAGHSGGGGGGRKQRGESAEALERKRVEALRKALDLQEEQRRADEDILSAKKDLSDDYVEQTSLEIAILDSQRAGYKAQLDFEVAAKEKTQAQADGLLAQYDIADSYKRQKVLLDEEDQRLDEVAKIEEADYDRKKELLEKQADLATTQSERRKIDLDILKLAYEEKKQALERIIANSKDEAAKENARRDLINLNKNNALDQQGVINSTRNPIEEWAASVPKSAAEINEALQSIEANGIQGLSEALTGVITGTESLKSAFHNLAASILADLIQMTIKMLLFKALQASFGGSFGGGGSVPVSGARASGGPVMGNQAYLVGERGPEIFMPKMSGSIIPNNRMNVGNDRSPTFNMPIHIDATGADAAGLARVQNQLDSLKSELPGLVVEYYTDARQRFVIRK